MNHPSISLAPGDNEWHDVMISNHVNLRLSDADTAFRTVKQHLDGSRPIIARTPDMLRRLDDFVHIGKASSATRIADAFLERASAIAPWPSDSLAQMGVIDKSNFSPRQRAKVGFDEADLAVAINEIKSFSEPNMDVAVTRIGQSLFQLAPAHG